MAKQTITDKIFADAYAKFQKLFKNMGTDADFAEYLNKNYLTKTGKSFNTDLIFYKRSALGIKSPVGNISPPTLKRFNEVNDFATKEVAKANLGNKFVRIEDIKNKVLKKFNRKSFANFKSEGYPVLNNLEKIPDKIDKVLRSLLISKEPLKQGFMNEIAKLTGISIDSINDNIPKSQTYNTIKDQGADLIKKSKGFPKDFYELPFSKQLPYAIEVSSGRPRYTGMGGITRYSPKPQNRIMEFAIRSWDNTKGKGPVKFFDKNGKLIRWGYGKKLPYTKVQWSYNGNRHNFDKLKSVDYMQKHFPEAYTKLKAINNLNVRPVDNPFKKGTKIPLRDLIKKIQVDGYGWKPTKGALDILHGKKGVALEPFTNLTYASRDINQLESGIAASLRANKITKTQANEAIKTIRQDIKGLTGESLDTAIINRQLDLSKQIQSGKISSYQDVKNLFLKKVKAAYRDAREGAPLRKYLESKKIANRADGCFIKVANKNPERIAKKLVEDPKLIRLFRGESFPQRNIKGFKDSAKHWGTTVAEMQKDTLAGQWFTPTQAHASSYLSRPGQMKYVDVTPQELEAFNKYKDRVNKRPVKYSRKKLEGLPDAPTHGVTESFHHQLIPRYKLKEMEKAGRLKTKWDLNPFGKKYISDAPLIPSPKGVLEYDDILGGFVDSAKPDEIVGQNQLKAWAQDNPMPVKVGEAAPGILKKTGKALAHLGLPLPTAAMDAYFIGREIEEGKSPEEIARNPLNWLGLATMDPLTKAAGMAEKSGKLASVMRLGMSPGLIRGATRFLGLPGLALSTGLTAYDQYQKYKNKEGFIYDLFNREEIDNAQV